MQSRRHTRVYYAAVLALLVFAPVLCLIPKAANAQFPAEGSVLVYPDAQSPLYGSIGHNWTITFQARYFYNHTEKPVSNATVEFKVTNAEHKVVNTFDCNTSMGTFNFNYTSNTPNILTFTPTKLVMQDESEWDVEHPERNSIVPYFSATVYWDTFNVTLVDSTTSNPGAANVAVKVTRLLVPTGTIATYGGEKTIALINSLVDDANVTINGVEAQKGPESGVYTANVSSAFPTAYTLVTVAHDGWRTTETAFSITHNANLKVWLIAASAVAASAVIYFLAFKLKAFKANRNSKYPFLGGVFLLFSALISLYWAALGIEAVIHGFSWLAFAALEVCCCLLGIACSLFSALKKYQAAVVFSVTALLVVNSVVAMSTLGAYGLPSPWLLVVAAVICCAASFFCVSNADKEFPKAK